MAVALIPAFALCACASNDVPAPDPSAPPPEPVDTRPVNSRGWPAGLATGAGHWWLADLSRAGQLVSSVFCLVTATGELSCVLYDPMLEYEYPFLWNGRAGAMHGVLHMTDAGEASGSGVIYAAPGEFLGDGKSVVAAYTITGGSLTDASSQLDLTISALGEELTLSAYFDHYYYLPDMFHSNPLGLLSRVYADAAFNGEQASLTIDDSGRLFSQTTSGCVLDGGVALIDTRYNAFAVSLTVANCPGRNGAYEGLATLIDFSWANGANHALFAVYNPDGFVLGEAVDWLDPTR